MALNLTPNIFKTLYLTPSAAGDTAIWTPTSGKKFRILRYIYEFPYSCVTSVAAGTLFNATLKDGATLIAGLTETIWIPPTGGSSGNIFIGSYVADRELGNGYLSTAANNVLSVTVDGALNTNAWTGFRISVYGTEE